MRRALLIAVAAFALAAPAAAEPPPPGIETTVGESSPPGVPPGPAAQGYALYGANCSSCHGSRGEGILGRQGAGGITAYGPSLRNVGARSAHLYLTTGYMPLHSPKVQPYRSRVLFTNEQIRALIAYVATLGGPPIPTPHPERGSLAEGLRLFTQNCAGCHQAAAKGGYVTGARVPPLNHATATQIAEAVRVGPYLMPAFSEKAISDAQLDSIIRYVEYTKHPDDRGGWSIGRIGPVPEGLVAWWIGALVLVGFCLLLGERLRR
jgi:ubiquinol-cytochrome c reductase cytochrome c subunit